MIDVEAIRRFNNCGRCGVMEGVHASTSFRVQHLSDDL